MNRFVWLGVILLASPALAADPGSDAKLAATARGLFNGIQSGTLPNGLQYHLLPIPGSPVVSTMVAYRVGSCDEDKDQTGLSHYLEHLLFKGTAKLLPGDIDRATQRNGGMNNAYTNNDMTVYHFDFAADRWTIALEIEADRMRNVLIDDKHEFQQEKGAVIAELKKYEDSPWELEEKAILPLLFAKEDPYSHPVIGQESHVRGATAEIIKRYYDKWYHPNNAAIVIVGGFETDQAKGLIAKLFGSIPKGELPQRRPVVPMERTKIVRKEFESKFDVPRLMLGFNTCKYGEPDDYALDLLESVLTTGRTSRLYKKLVEGEELANEVSAYSQTGRYPGWFRIQVEMLEGKDRAKAEKWVFAELERLAKEPVTPEELVRVKRSAMADFIFSKESVHSQADLIAQTTVLADLDYLRSYLDKLLAVTAADLQRVARKYFDRNKAVVVWSVPEGAAKPVPAGKPARQANRVDAGGSKAFNLKDAKRTVLPNGLTLVTLENRRLPIVYATAHVADIRLREPAEKSGVAALVSMLLDEGTSRNTGEAIATLIENTGGALDFSPEGGTVKVLTADTELGLRLLFEGLTEPSFPAEALERKRAQLLSIIADVETQPQNRARNLFRSEVYGSHPYGRSRYGARNVVEKLSAADLKSFHKLAYIPNATTVVVVGDFDTAELIAKVAKMTENWKKSERPAFNIQPPTLPKKPLEKIVTDKTAAQTHVMIGHLGIKRDDPDYYTLLVMDNVLGTGPGFTDRLSANLRDRQGLAYTVNAQIANSATDQPGLFAGYIGTFPEKYTIAKEGFLSEIGKIRAEPATGQEVEDAKKFLLGSLPFRLTTNSGVAAELLAAERFGLGFDYLDKYREKVTAVTPADVLAAARKHLDPNRLVIVAVGPNAADGKPVVEPKKR